MMNVPHRGARTCCSARIPPDRLSSVDMRRPCLLGGLACSIGVSFAQTVPADQDADRNVSWKTLAPNVLSDQKAIWLSPLKLRTRRYWIPTTVVLGITAGLIALDPPEGRYFRNTSFYNGFNSVFSGNATAAGTAIAPLSLYAVGLIRKDAKMKTTAMLAGEAVADSEILTTVLKDADRRLRPIAVPTKGNYSDTWFDDSSGILRSHGSFPSGHSIAAFSVATVVARRYRSHRWVPFVAYGSAALIGCSRMTLSAHFAWDVFVGGVLGYSIGRFAVLRQ
jgi:membrane-associated phospholipid phosphatase